jgi:hypothetical protein
MSTKTEKSRVSETSCTASKYLSSATRSAYSPARARNERMLLCCSGGMGHPSPSGTKKTITPFSILRPKGRRSPRSPFARTKNNLRTKNLKLWTKARGVLFPPRHRAHPRVRRAVRRQAALEGEPRRVVVPDRLVAGEEKTACSRTTTAAKSRQVQQNILKVTRAGRRPGVVAGVRPLRRRGERPAPDAHGRGRDEQRVLVHLERRRRASRRRARGPVRARARPRLRALRALRALHELRALRTGPDRVLACPISTG